MLDTDSTNQFYADLNGNPLQGGQLFFGVAGQNPVTSPITVYWDAAATQPAAQPISVKNGRATRNGAPARVYIPSDYSKLVQDSKGRQVSFDASLAAPARTALAGPGGAALVSFQQNYAGAALQDLQTVLRNGDVFVTQFMLPADLADMALANPLRDQTANIQAAVDSGAKRVLFPKGNYRRDGTVTLRDGVQLIGASSIQDVGTRMYFTKTDGTACFASDPTKFLSAVSVENMEIVHATNAPGAVGLGSAFQLYACTNNCRFKNLLIRNMPASAFAVGKQTTTLTDNTALQNVLFEQIFVTSCGGYAFDVSGYVNATWMMCDLNSCATGFFRFADGTTNQTMINCFGLWIEGTQAWSALTVFDMQDTKGQMLNLIACDFTNGRAGTSRVVLSTTSSCRINASGCTGFGWTNGLHEDTPVGNTVPLANPTNYSYQPVARQMTVQGSGPVVDIYQDVGGTVDQRRFRFGFTGNKLLLSARLDNGGSARNLWTINHSTGVWEPGADNAYNFGSATLRWSTIFAGTSTINTSDMREKQQIRELSVAEKAVAVRLKGLIRAYKFNDAVAKKGDAARIHVGVMAQDVQAAFAAEGLDGMRYGVLCFDAWDAAPAEYDEEGLLVVPARAAGSRYGVRYEELVAFVISAL